MRVLAVLVVSLALIAGCATTDRSGASAETGNSTSESGSLNSPALSDYRIGPEDVLEISVWQEEDLHREVLVRPDGGVSFPLAGDIHVAGRTTREVRDDISARIDDYIPGAMVNVSVVEVSGYQIYVLGKVNNPGQFTVGRYVDVVQALTLAGGLTPFAAESRISVIRRGDSREEVYPFDYRSVKRGRGLDQNRILQSGDVILVP